MPPRQQNPRELRTRLVQFRVSDVCVPACEEILHQLYSQSLLQGKILDLSDSGEEREAFAVVEVRGLDKPVVVPVSKLVRLETSEPGSSS